MREQLLYYAVKYEGEWLKISKAIGENEPWKTLDYEGTYTTLMDKDYPSALRIVHHPPWVIFYEGDLTLLNEPSMGIIGTQKIESETQRITEEITDTIKQDYVIVSGLGSGVSQCAHRQALNAKTIGVIGTGINIVYPNQNKFLQSEMSKKQLVLSEYPKDTRPYAFHYPWRNRILAAISDSLIVVAAEASNIVTMAGMEALEQGKPVYCIPHEYDSVYAVGCSILVNAGAKVLGNQDEVMELLQHQEQKETLDMYSQ